MYPCFVNFRMLSAAGCTNDNNWRISQLAYDPAQGKAFQQRQFLTDYIDRISVSEWPADLSLCAFVATSPPIFHHFLRSFCRTSVAEHTGELPQRSETHGDLLVDLIEKLKAEGIYDQTAILFHSDHGGGFEPDFMPRRLMGLMASSRLPARAR